MAEYAVQRSEGPVVERAPARRTLSAALGIAVIALAFVGMFVASLIQPAFIDSYRTEGTTLWVGYGPKGDCDTMMRVRAIESAEAVTLDIVGFAEMPFVASTAEQPICTVTFELESPLGDRELRLASGESVSDAWARVGR